MRRPHQNYITDELSHFVGRGKDVEDQFNLLLRILDSGWLTHPPHNLHESGNLRVNSAANFSSNDMYNPQMVCFCDIPADELGIHCLKYGKFGLSFSKRFVSDRGGRPVLYVPRDGQVHVFRVPGQREWRFSPVTIENLTVDKTFGAFFDHCVSELTTTVREAYTRPGDSPAAAFLDFHLLSYIKFFDLHLEDAHQENFYLEREWRIVGNLQFQLKDLRRVFVPSGFRARVLERFPSVSCREL